MFKKNFWAQQKFKSTKIGDIAPECPLWLRGYFN